MKTIGSAILAALFLTALPAGAVDLYPATAFFAEGLSASSSWKDILAKRTVQGEFPVLDFGPTFVTLSAVCVDGSVLRIADPRLDNGVTVAVDDVRSLLRAADREDRLAAAGPVAAPDQPLGYPVSVYRIFPRPLSVERVFLFDKLWEIPRCPTR
jgi:hypothetical protein